MNTNADLNRLVMQELAWDTRLLATELNVDVHEGVVRLTGSVSSYGERMAAQEAVQRIEGVRNVVNDIEVWPRNAWTRFDSEIAAAVRQALEWNVFVPDTRIRSTVSDGCVLLEGEVDTFAEREAAEQAIGNLAGVKSVRNEIRVVPRSIPTNVRRSIEEALKRQAASDTARLEIEVHDGCVTLSGVVRSRKQQQAIVGAARGTYGVRSVADHLRLEPYPPV